MRAYVIRRLLLMIPTAFVVTMIIFLLIRLIPGDAIDAMAERLSRQGIEIKAAREDIERLLGLDVPIIEQYGRWLGVAPQADGSFSGIFQGDLGSSYWRPTTVLEDIARRWPVTLELGIMALIIAQLIALPIGIFSALRQDTWGDYIARSFAILLIAVPSFWIATMIMVFPALWWGYFPPIMHVPFLEDPLRNLIRFIVPATCLGMAMSGGTMRMTRTMVLEVLRQDYIRTAWAKGLRERAVILRHTLKNALIPVVTLIGFQVPLLIGGAVIIETIFVLPGMGSLSVEATRLRDYPVIIGIMLVLGSFIMLINLMVDLTYAYLDPRVHYK
ncbi:Dipeptide transport system permease protein DppB [subsurface metagenome]